MVAVVMGAGAAGRAGAVMVAAAMAEAEMATAPAAVVQAAAVLGWVEREAWRNMTCPHCKCRPVVGPLKVASPWTQEDEGG